MNATLDIGIATRSERGSRAENEDNACVLQDEGRWVAVLADGAGGHRDGAEASRRAVAQVDAVLHGTTPTFEPDSLTRAVLDAHASVREGQAITGAAMHTTLVVLWLDGARGVLWSHVGDSRLYRVRDGHVEQLTTDDSVVQYMVAAGMLTPDQAATHPHRNELAAALGIEGELHPHTLASPAPLAEGDAYLLCSDGWWHGLDEDCIAGTLAQSRTPEDWLDGMQRRILSLAEPRQDNFSAIAVWIGDAGEVTRPTVRVLAARV